MGLLRNLADATLAFLAMPAAHLLRAYRQRGSRSLPLTTAVLRRVGVFPIVDHYYEPSFRGTLPPVSNASRVPRVNLNTPEQLSFLTQLTFAQELEHWRGDKSNDPSDFDLNNDSFGAGDAEFLYQFIRWSKPSRVIEIGSGHSTKIVVQALNRNAQESGIRATHVCIEPYEMNWLESLPVQVIRRRVEECDMDWSAELQKGDLLFIDSSHVIRPNGDILCEYLQILPQLAAGVYVHIHDIFTPRDYPDRWLFEEVKFWNEQYMLECALSHSSRYRVVAALNNLKHQHFPELSAICPFLMPEREPGSFYIQVQ